LGSSAISAYWNAIPFSPSNAKQKANRHRAGSLSLFSKNATLMFGSFDIGFGASRF
jgi:hypothetical protein